MSCGSEGKIRRWRVEAGKDSAGTPMDAESPVCVIEVSRDGKRIASEMYSGLVTVWNAKNHSNLTAFKASKRKVFAVGVSPDATRIATGLAGKIARVR